MAPADKLVPPPGGDQALNPHLWLHQRPNMWEVELGDVREDGGQRSLLRGDRAGRAGLFTFQVDGGSIHTSARLKLTASSHVQIRAWSPNKTVRQQRAGHGPTLARLPPITEAELCG